MNAAAETRIEAGGPEKPGGFRALGGLLTAQFLGAFNDNAWKQLVIMLAIAAAAGEADGASAKEAAAQRKTAIAQIVLMIPLMAISLPAGLLADRVSKKSVIVSMKAFELALMVLGTAALKWHPAGGMTALAVLSLLGVQAALFSPAKYGILPELLPHDQLSKGNGFLETCTNLAIIGGIVGGGVLFWMTKSEPWHAGMLLILCSVAGIAASLAIPDVPPARAEGGLAATVRMAYDAIRADRVLRLAVIGQVIVWSIASLVPVPIMPYATIVLELEGWMSGLPLAALGIGIGAGCLLAARLSAANVEYGLIPLGAFGMALSALVFAAWGPGLAGTMLVLGVLGLFAGLLLVPLNAIIQWRAPADRRGAVIAFTNVLVYTGMLIGSVVALGLAKAEVSAQGVFSRWGPGSPSASSGRFPSSPRPSSGS
ncbi:MFS transporter [Paludisphaera borealis]|uniref:MFS transporter n=1 Tax=Paludisphaera borealis TaxID=1387353 RepID=UPI001F02D973|nr:MFS transporter [Paludisphaera borealis]